MLRRYDPNIYWETARRKLVEISKMSEPHLLNTINMLSRKIEELSGDIEYSLGAVSQGEVATAFLDQAFDNTCDLRDYLLQRKEILVKEAIKRGLK